MRSRTPGVVGAVRCTAPSSTSEVRRPELRPKRCWRAWHGRVVFDVWRFCHGSFHRVSSGSICFANTSPVACSSLAFASASQKSSSLCARKRRHPVVQALFSSQRSLIARHAHAVDDCRRHALCITMASNRLFEIPSLGQFRALWA